jgi:hypothetical protein
MRIFINGQAPFYFAGGLFFIVPAVLEKYNMALERCFSSFQGSIMGKRACICFWKNVFHLSSKVE